MPENMIFESGGVVAYVLDDQVLRRPVLQSRRRSGRASAGKDIGAAGRVASEVDRRRVFLRVRRETPEYTLSSPPDHPCCQSGPRSLNQSSSATLYPGDTTWTGTGICMPWTWIPWWTYLVETTMRTSPRYSRRLQTVGRVRTTYRAGSLTQHRVPLDMDPEALIMTKTFSLLDAMSAFEVGTVATE